MNIYEEIKSPFIKEVAFLLGNFRKRFLFSIHKYSKNLIKNIVKKSISSYNKFNVRKRNMRAGGELT